jgi:hypothetical protein
VYYLFDIYLHGDPIGGEHRELPHETEAVHEALQFIKQYKASHVLIYERHNDKDVPLARVTCNGDVFPIK